MMEYYWNKIVTEKKNKNYSVRRKKRIKLNNKKPIMLRLKGSISMFFFSFKKIHLSYVNLKGVMQCNPVTINS